MDYNLLTTDALLRCEPETELERALHLRLLKTQLYVESADPLLAATYRTVIEYWSLTDALIKRGAIKLKPKAFEQLKQTVKAAGDLLTRFEEEDEVEFRARRRKKRRG